MNVLGKQGLGDLEFNTPSGMTVGKDGMVYVCDTFNSRIQILDNDLSFHGYMGYDGALKAPYDITVNSLNMFYIADYSDHIVKIFSKRGEFLGQIETIMNTMNISRVPCLSGVSVFDANGKFLMTIPIKVVGCYGILSDKDGHLYICDRANRRIIIYK